MVADAIRRAIDQVRTLREYLSAAVLHHAIGLIIVASRISPRPCHRRPVSQRDDAKAEDTGVTDAVRETSRSL
jgi:hypothetical protein